VFLRGGASGPISTDDVLAGLALSGHFLTARVLGPRDMQMPDARARLLAYLRRP
jgi:DNA repair protein RecO (recombination protein O)